MKIAIVAPSPIPFTVGGMESLMMGLYTAILRETNHQAELIKLPVREDSFWNVIEAYRKFYELDLSHFDLVITSKYPAWMVRHDNCVFYVAHRLRGLYDTYGSDGKGDETPRTNANINRLLEYMDHAPRPESLDEFFRLLDELKKNSAAAEEAFYAFPGPLIRRLVHYMDDYAFARPRNAKYFSISETVRERRDYFPIGAEVTPVYPPTTKTAFSTGEYRYIFTASRLDAPKRLELLIRAMKFVRSNVKLYIAGTGPQAERLKELARGDDRIEFLGYISDELLEKYYADSLVIPFFPQAEDFGLITLEAMLHKKPVITTTDAGGPTEFVENDVTGYIVPAEPERIAEKLDYFAEHPEEAKRMGENACERASAVTWKKLLDTIIPEPEAVIQKKKLAVTSTFPIWPPQGGGQSRIFNLYRKLAKEYEVEIVSYTLGDMPHFSELIAPSLHESRVPMGKEHSRHYRRLNQKAGADLRDIAQIRYGSETAEYCGKLKKAIGESAFCVVSHPYLYPTAKKLLNGRPFIYEAHNVEYLLKQGILPESGVKKELLEEIFRTEKACCDESLLVMTCSDEDRDKLHELYHTPKDKILVVPNGVDTGEIRFVSAEERQNNKKSLGLEKEKLALFIGSYHGPNLEACRQILELAPKCPETHFLLMGSQCNAFYGTELPRNVALLGTVDEETKRRVYSCVDFALNPMLSGSGTNLKMFDYMAAGIPVLSTPLGARGIEEKEHFIECDGISAFAAAIREFTWTEQMAERVKKARDYAEKTFDWEVIAGKLCAKLHALESETE